MIITKQIGKIHYWKMFGKITPENLIESSKELLEMYDEKTIEVCVADISEVKTSDISRDILKHSGIFNHSRGIPTFIFGTNTFIRLVMKIINKLYPESTKNIMIVKTKKEAFDLANSLIKNDS